MECRYVFNGCKYPAACAEADCCIAKRQPDPYRLPDMAARMERLHLRRLDAATRDAFKQVYGWGWKAAARNALERYPEEAAGMVLGLWRARNGYR